VVGNKSSIFKSFVAWKSSSMGMGTNKRHILVLKKSFKINDLVEIQGSTGRVLELNLHDSIIEYEEKYKITIPNNLISNGVIKKNSISLKFDC